MNNNLSSKPTEEGGVFIDLCLMGDESTVDVLTLVGTQQAVEGVIEFLELWPVQLLSPEMKAIGGNKHEYKVNLLKSDSEEIRFFMEITGTQINNN